MPIYAAADIGSNTLHLLIAKANENSVTHLSSQSNWLSLGSIVSKKGHLPASLLNDIVLTLEDFKKAAKIAGAESIYIFATEAVRLADNHRELVNRIYRELKLNISIIDPIKEAELSWKGALLNSYNDFPVLFIEVGGGSVQIAIGEGAELHSICSLPLGTGKLITQFDLVQPIAFDQLEKVKLYANKQLNCLKNIANIKTVVASGGVAKALVRALHPDGEPTITKEEIDYLMNSASKLDVKQISKRFNIKSKRAASIVPGTLVFSMILTHFKQENMFVSKYGVREGAILSLFEKKLIPCPL